ncbi:hypothetical protein U9M48_000487 [Paspalum notatum var. saurae]|uniref:Retrotransposon protein, putative, Ty3-gypsy subclass n=1 Tax=Paspalum notatum var. saurae TaxID=547442 RepID=A0AAQ3PH18_PASNO
MTEKGQLRGAALDWWESYRPQDRDAFTWAQFRENFCNHHVLAGLMKMKKKEFLSLKQGSMSVTEYRDKFLQLATYATTEVADDMEKQEYFMEGLNDELQYQLMNHTFPSFHQLVDRAHFTERKRPDIEERKRKFSNSSSSSNTRPRYTQGQNSQQQGYQQRTQGQQGNQYPQRCQGQQMSQGQHYQSQPTRPAYPTQRQVQTNSPATNQTTGIGPCYKCSGVGHYANVCPRKVQGNQQGQQQGQRQNPPQQQQGRPNQQGKAPWQGKVNHVTAETAVEAPNVVLGIDIILGMETLAKWGVRIDCAKRRVYLTALDGQKVEISATEPSGYLHQMEAKPTDGIRVVCDYPDVFPDELPGYYRRFIENFSRIAKPMTSLLEKGAEFNWTKERQASFDELKKRLTTTPVLTLPDPAKSFTVYCDASKEGLGCVLMQEEFESLSLGFVHHTTTMTFEAEPTLEQEIKTHQKTDGKIQEILEQIKLGKAPFFHEDEQGTIWYKNRICVPDVDSIRKLILSEAHDTAYSIHPGSTKMYYDLKERFWWYGMKRVVAEYVAVCDTCQWVKAEYQRPAGARLAELYISRIVCLHGVPKRIISDRGSQFTSRFWEQLHDSLDTKLRFSTAYYPQTDGQTERTNQILEDMLRACAIQYGTSWDKSLPYAKFSYNNSYQSREKQVFGPNLIKDAEQQIKIVRENLRVAQSRQKSYADVRRRDLTFKVGDFVYLKVSPMRGIRRFNIKGKLAPRFIGPFKVLERKGEVAYKLELPPSLAGIHDVFHVSQLKKCLRVPEEQAPLEGLDMQEDLTYTEHPVKILETSERVTRNKRIKICRVQWKHHTEEEATWEREEELRAAYPDLFANHQ